MRGFILCLAALLAACATTVTPINEAATGAPPPPHERNNGEDVLALALSGGGARAASFHLGVLKHLAATSGRDGRRLTEHIAFITAVSGGSVLSAYYGLHGDAGLETFRAAYLDRNWRIRRESSPLNWGALLSGGMNGPEQLADWLDRNVYEGHTIAELTRGPRIILNATDLYNYTAFAFTPLYFDGLCSDVQRVRVADAVAASMAVPMIFRPVVARSYSDDPSCSGTPDWVRRALADRTTPEDVRATAQAFRNYRAPSNDGLPANFVHAGQRYVHLSDGGVVDNLGVSSLMIMRAAEPAPSPLTRREAVGARRLLILVVNAEYVRDRTFQSEATDALGLQEGVYGPIDASTEAAKRQAMDAFRAGLPAFEEDVRNFRCGLSADEARALGAPANWNCRDFSIRLEVVSFRDMNADDYRALYNLDTDVSITNAQVTRLIAAGQDVASRNAALAEVVQQ
jgi:NTE family protein